MRAARAPVQSVAMYSSTAPPVPVYALWQGDIHSAATSALHSATTGVPHGTMAGLLHSATAAVLHSAPAAYCTPRRPAYLQGAVLVDHVQRARGPIGGVGAASVRTRSAARAA
eukprot:110532-Chlamydomonas_euryale.AAC.1